MIHELIDAELRFVSSIGDKNFILVVLAFLGVCVLFAFKHKQEALLLILSCISFIASYILKFIFKFPRPVTAQIDFALDYYSFPSSHVMAYTVIFGYVLYLTFKIKRLSRFLRYILQSVSIYFIALVGVSRVYLGQHFPADVYAGYIFGAIYLIGIIILDKKLSDSRAKNKN